MIEHEEIAKLKQWLNTEPGCYARTWEQQQMSDLSANVFGYHAIQIGMPHWDLLRNNRILRKWYTHTQPEATAAGTSLVLCVPEQLPFASESIDLLILPHALEMSYDPHQVLREVQRVLVPEGQVILSGFNPWSLWGIRDRLPGLESLMPVAPSQQLSVWRVADWLALLSFEVTTELTGCYSPLCSQARWLQRWGFMDKLGARWWPMLGAVHVIKATKRVNSITMVGIDWPKKTTSPLSSAAVASRNMQRQKQKGTGQDPR